MTDADDAPQWTPDRQAPTARDRPAIDVFEDDGEVVFVAAGAGAWLSAEARAVFDLEGVR